MSDQDVKDAVAKELSDSPYPCSTLTQLSGGTANFVYRGVLSEPLQDGKTTVIVKHTEDYVASNRDFKLSAQRCVCFPSRLPTVLTSYIEYPTDRIHSSSKNRPCAA
jgi:hypothetical protein